MTKAEELARNAKGEGTLGRTADDEPIFVICGRDRTAPKTIRQWAENAKNMGCANAEKIAEAMAFAVVIEHWQRAHPDVAKVPD